MSAVRKLVWVVIASSNSSRPQRSCFVEIVEWIVEL